MPISAIGNRVAETIHRHPGAGGGLGRLRRDGCIFPDRDPHRRGGDTGFQALSPGFTLVELLVVLAILALVTSTIVFAVRPGGRDVRAEAESLAAKASAARDIAIIGARPIRLTVTPEGYDFAARKHGAWRAMTEKPFKPASWSDGMKITGASVVTFDATGVSDATAPVILAKEGVQLRVILNGSAVPHVAP
jgi:general secretion pathway protein H